MNILYYRFHDRAHVGGEVSVNMSTYKVKTTTATGMWLQPLAGGKARFMKTEAKRKFACLNVEAARVSYIARKQSQIKLYEAMLKATKASLKIVADERREIPAGDMFGHAAIAGGKQAIRLTK